MMSQHPAINAMYKEVIMADWEFARDQVLYWEDQLKVVERAIINYHREKPPVTLDNRDKIRQELNTLDEEYNDAVKQLTYWQREKENLRTKIEGKTKPETGNLKF